MAIQLPRVLKNLNLFVDGRGYAGRVDEITLPKLTVKTEEHRAGGMDAPVRLDMGMEALEATLMLAELDESVFATFGLLGRDAIPVTVRGAIQAQGAEAQAVVVNLRGGWQELDPGTWKVGDRNGLTVKMACSYYKLAIADRDLVEIDIPNLVRLIDGKDQLEGQRTALGI